jgi:hypothetical protein
MKGTVTASDALLLAFGGRDQNDNSSCVALGLGSAGASDGGRSADDHSGADRSRCAEPDRAFDLAALAG